MGAGRGMAKNTFYQLAQKIRREKDTLKDLDIIMIDYDYRSMNNE